MINKIDRCKTNCNKFSAYDLPGYTVQELLCNFFTKINECIDLTNDMKNTIDDLVTKGLTETVLEQLNKWLEDGTLNEIINNELLGDLYDKINLLLEDRVNVKNHGAKGDGTVDDSLIINQCYTLAKTFNKSVYIPNGEYLVSNVINVPSEISTFGGGKNNTVIICNHEREVFNFNKGVNQYANQGGDLTFSDLTIKRATRPSSKIVGNYGLRFYATYGVTTIENIEIKMMGDHAIYQNDTTLSGTGPMHFKGIRCTNNVHGYGVYFEGTFANLYFDGCHSWGNGGGYALKGASSSVVPTQLVSISNCDNEYIGGYKQGTDPLPSGTNTGHGLYCENVRSLSVTNGTTFQTSKEGTNETFVSSKHCVVLKSVHNAFFESSCDIAQRFTGADGILVYGDCTNININGVTVFGSNVGRYNINVVDGAKNVSINIPSLSGFNPNYCKLGGATNPIFINTGTKLGFLKENYEGSFILLNTQLTL